MAHPFDGSSPLRGGLFRRQTVEDPPGASPILGRTRYLIDGKLSPTPDDVTIAEAYQFAESDPTHVAFTVFPSPTVEAVDQLATAWNLDPVLVEDLQRGGQRPKLERYQDVLFIVVRSAHYIDETEDVEFAEFHLLLRSRAVVVLCQDQQWIDGTDVSGCPQAGSIFASHSDQLLEEKDNLLNLGAEAIIYRFLDAVVDGYVPVLHGLELDKEQIELQVFNGDGTVTERIYRLSQEIIGLHHATTSLTDVLEALERGFQRYGIPIPLQTHLQDVSDHLTRVNAHVVELRDALSQILSVNATLVAQRQNEDMKKISGWAAILFAPTLIGAIYGMNFTNMPELSWWFGYPLAVGGMVALAIGLYAFFKIKKWM